MTDRQDFLKAHGKYHRMVIPRGNNADNDEKCARCGITIGKIAFFCAEYSKPEIKTGYGWEGGIVMKFYCVECADKLADVVKRFDNGEML